MDNCMVASRIEKKMGFIVLPQTKRLGLRKRWRLAHQITCIIISIAKHV